MTHVTFRRDVCHLKTVSYSNGRRWE